MNKKEFVLRRIFAFMMGIVVISMISSCATIISGTKASVTVRNDNVKEPVTLTVDKKVYPNVMLPAEIEVKRGYKPTTIVGISQNYETTTPVTVSKEFNFTFLWNFLLGGIPGMAIDAATGAVTKPDAKEYFIPMQLKQQPVVDNREVEEVDRRNPVKTELERTVVRWYFESQPQGARIFWRVISSIPDQVRNTNELWLGNTPFEETRSFNIQGLTYENSNDVQIEIKVRMNGYRDQTRRFNVRQAIDQQEISSFFDMIKIEE